jgi:hypothetical protein
MVKKDKYKLMKPSNKNDGLVQINPEFLMAIKDVLTPEQKKELVDGIIKSSKKMEKSRINHAIKIGVLTKEDYEKNYKRKYVDDWGLDSFPEYMQAVSNMKKFKDDNLTFVTSNRKMLKDKDKLEEKFGLEIKSPKECIDMIESEEMSGTYLQAM